MNNQMEAWTERFAQAMGEVVAKGNYLFSPDPIHTRHVGTIAFQGTQAEIEAMMLRAFGKEERT